jgi:sialate O-acetylesterase
MGAAMNRPLASLLALALFAAAPCRADVVLPSLFSDNMVLQQRSKINVWGKADPGESVTVQMGPDTAQTTAARDGSWSVNLDGLKSGGPYDLTVYGKNSVTIHNVAIGEVWVCGGESNMEFKLIEAQNGQLEAANGDLPEVRVFTVWHDAAKEPQVDCDGAWVVCDPITARNLSAIGFFFARELNQGMRVPIGLIQSAWSGSTAEAWTPRATLENDADLKQTLDRYTESVSNYPVAQAAYEAKLKAWKAAGSPAGHEPLPPLAPTDQRKPGELYNGMIHPLERYAIRGVLWDQGESNTSEPQAYRKLFSAMISSWRQGWDEGDFPFLYVQLSSFLARHAQPTESRWAEFREAQAAAMALPKTGMAVTIDLGGPHEMHPADKQDVAHRLALIAENQVYGNTKVVDSGPVFSEMDVEDGKAILSFTHVDDGLVARNGPPLKGFAIAGADQRFVWADAAIHGSKVILQSIEVADPVAVRYAWADSPDCSLFNQANLPTAPFRTDNWIPGISAATPSPAPPDPQPKPKKRRPAN